MSQSQILVGKIWIVLFQIQWQVWSTIGNIASQLTAQMGIASFGAGNTTSSLTISLKKDQVFGVFFVESYISISHWWMVHIHIDIFVLVKGLFLITSLLDRTERFWNNLGLYDLTILLHLYDTLNQKIISSSLRFNHEIISE